MAVFRARGVAVAAGVPTAFALVAALLTVASSVPSARAAEPRSARIPASVIASDDPSWTLARRAVRTTRPPLAVSFRLPVADPVAFITIDDGVTKDARGLRYVEERRLPITAFVSTWTVKDRARYFTRITRWGSVQNHTATHASLARSTTDLDHEICYAQRALTRDFGTRPWLLRPPYGAGYARQETQVAAERCGISHVVLWDAVVEEGRLTVARGRLAPGAVVLLHFTPNLATDLRAAVRAIRAAGLTPASLADYLPAPGSPAAS